MLSKLDSGDVDSRLRGKDEEGALQAIFIVMTVMQGYPKRAFGSTWCPTGRTGRVSHLYPESGVGLGVGTSSGVG